MIARLLRELRLVAETSRENLTVRAALQIEVWQEDANESTLARYFLHSEHRFGATKY